MTVSVGAKLTHQRGPGPAKVKVGDYIKRCKVTGEKAILTRLGRLPERRGWVFFFFFYYLLFILVRSWSTPIFMTVPVQKSDTSPQ